MVDCSEKLLALRKARNLTQQQLARRVGVSKAMISAYETASKAPSLDVLIRLSAVFGVSVDYLICINSPKQIDVSGLDDDAIALVAALVEKLKSARDDEGRA